MIPTDDVTDCLRSIGLRTSKEALRALLEHATRSRLSPAQTCEELVTLERRERDARNLADRTKAAALGKVKPLDRFDWSQTPARSTDPCMRSCSVSDSSKRERTPCSAAQAASGRPRWPRIWAWLPCRRATQSVSPPSRPPWPIS